MVHLGPEFHPPAPPPEPEPEISDEQPKEEPQPMVMGQPVAEVVKAATRRPRTPRKKPAVGPDGMPIGAERRVTVEETEPEPGVHRYRAFSYKPRDLFAIYHCLDQSPDFR